MANNASETLPVNERSRHRRVFDSICSACFVYVIRSIYIHIITGIWKPPTLLSRSSSLRSHSKSL